MSRTKVLLPGTGCDLHRGLRRGGSLQDRRPQPPALGGRQLEPVDQRDDDHQEQRRQQRRQRRRNVHLQLRKDRTQIQKIGSKIGFQSNCNLVFIKYSFCVFIPGCIPESAT